MPLGQRNPPIWAINSHPDVIKSANEVEISFDLPNREAFHHSSQGGGGGRSSSITKSGDKLRLSHDQLR